MTRCRAVVCGLLAAAVVVLVAPAPEAAAAGGVAAGAGGVAAAAAEPPGKVLIVSMPRLVWQDVVDQRPPHLMQLLGQSAVASLSVRAIGPRTDIGEGYVTLGAGNRARVDRSRAGDAVDADEQIGPNTGAAIYRALTGHDPAARPSCRWPSRTPAPTPTTCSTAPCPAPWERPSRPRAAPRRSSPTPTAVHPRVSTSCTAKPPWR